MILLKRVAMAFEDVVNQNRFVVLGVFRNRDAKRI